MVTLAVACVWQAPRICVCEREHFTAAELCDVCERRRSHAAGLVTRRWALQWREEYRAEQAAASKGRG